MTRPELLSSVDAAPVLSHVFAQDAIAGSSLALEVREQECFGESWASVGEISVHPKPNMPSPTTAPPTNGLEFAFRYGAFEWHIPAREEIKKTLHSAVADGKSKEEEKRDRQIDEVANAVARIAVRCGLAHPVLDPLFVSRLPFQESVVIVMDTSAVLQGGLDFVLRHLTPPVQISVPAIVHMEILNFADRFFTRRRASRATVSTLFDHTRSQAGQRALLRLERTRDVERPRLGADPLRGIGQPDTDAEDRSLGIQRVPRSFADRLIVETAIQRRSEARPGLDVMLMTADQGLARMAMAEGITSIFLDATAVHDLFGATLSGVPFRPVRQDGPMVYPVPFASVLWECATTFGSARIRSRETGSFLEVIATGKDLSWQPHHTSEDLLWVRHRQSKEPSSHRPPKPRDDDASSRSTTSTRSQPIERRLSGSYSFSPRSLLRLVSALAVGSVSDSRGMEITGTKTLRSYDPYLKFLTAGGFLIRVGDEVESRPVVAELLTVLRSREVGRLRTLWARVPSMGRFFDAMDRAGRVTREDAQIRESAFSTYCTLAEICCAGIRSGKVFHTTPKNPPADDFAVVAAQAYDVLRKDGDYVLTGAWLEHLVAQHQIHPVRSRERLDEAAQAGYVHRYFEGSTPETRYRNRDVDVLEEINGDPSVRRINLYYGDFLLRGRATTRIRVVRKST